MKIQKIPLSILRKVRYNTVAIVFYRWAIGFILWDPNTKSELEQEPVILQMLQPLPAIPKPP
jgi:hypothetical protein